MNVPKLRFKDDDGQEFPGWIEKIMGDTLSIFSGYAFSSNHSQSNGVKWLKIADVGIQQMIPSNPSYLPFELKDKHRNFLVSKDDYVIALTRPILNGKLKIARVDQNYDGSLLNQRVGKLVSNEVIDFVYFLLQLKNTVSQISDTISGTDPPNLSLNEIKGIKLKIPRNREEQTKIASFLTVIDEKISQLTQKYDLLTQYKKGVMQQIFSQKLRFKDDDGREFPEWETKKLGEVFSEVTEKVKNQNFETYSITAGKGFVSQREKFGRDISGKQNSNYICLKPFQFAYNKGNSKTFTYGCVYANLTGKDIAVPNVFISFRSKLPIATNYYSKLFEWHYLDKFLKKLISSTARMDGLLNVSKHYFFKIDIPYPTYKEQTKIANFLTAIDDKITQTQTRLYAVKQYKKGLLQQMFV
jgi:type I restriction enzyme S subunit